MKFFKVFISGTTRATDFRLSVKKDLWTLISKQVSAEPQPCGSGENLNPGKVGNRRQKFQILNLKDFTISRIIIGLTLVFHLF